MVKEPIISLRNLIPTPNLSPYDIIDHADPSIQVYKPSLMSNDEEKFVIIIVYKIWSQKWIFVKELLSFHYLSNSYYLESINWYSLRVSCGVTSCIPMMERMLPSSPPIVQFMMVHCAVSSAKENCHKPIVLYHRVDDVAIVGKKKKQTKGVETLFSIIINP